MTTAPNAALLLTSAALWLIQPNARRAEDVGLSRLNGMTFWAPDRCDSRVNAVIQSLALRGRLITPRDVRAYLQATDPLSLVRCHGQLTVRCVRVSGGLARTVATASLPPPGPRSLARSIKRWCGGDRGRAARVHIVVARLMPRKQRWLLDLARSLSRGA